MKFILDAKVVFYGNLPNVLVCFLKGVSKSLNSLLKSFLG